MFFYLDFVPLALLPLMATRLQNLYGITAYPHPPGLYTKKEPMRQLEEGLEEGGRGGGGGKERDGGRGRSGEEEVGAGRGDWEWGEVAEATAAFKKRGGEDNRTNWKRES